MMQTSEFLSLDSTLLFSIGKKQGKTYDHNNITFVDTNLKIIERTRICNDEHL